MSKIEVTLLTGRTIDQGTSKEFGKLSREYQEAVAICELDLNDMKSLGIKENNTVKVSTEHGSVIVKAKESKRAPHPKVVYMPYGLWANMVVGSRTNGTGMPSFKGISAMVQAAPAEEVAPLPQLLKTVFRRH